MDTSSSAPVRRLSAVWFADIVGFTALAGNDEGAAFRLVTILQRVARKVAEQDFGGRIVKFIGDAALAEFTSTDAAVRAAIAVQETFDHEARAAGRPAQLRIGVHLGEVIATPDGDIYGDGVNTASRLQGEASPGKVLISEDVWRQLRTRPEFQFRSLGEVELRGITARVAVFDVLFGARAAVPGGKASGAGAATIAALSAALSGSPTAAPRTRGALWFALGLLAAAVGVAGLYYAMSGTPGTAGPVTADPGAPGTTGSTSRITTADSLPAGTPQASAPQGSAAATGGATPPDPVANRATGQGAARAGQAEEMGRNPARGSGRGQAAGTERASSSPPAPPAGSGAAADPPAPNVADPVRERDLAISQAMAALDSLVRAVERGSTADLSRALPFSAGDLAQFEQVFSGASGAVKGSVVTPRLQRIDASGAEIQFLFSMEFTDGRGTVRSVPLPLRAFVARTPRGWRIDTIGVRGN
jgi:class 3 adenylate cyclase